MFCIELRKAFAIKSIPRSVFRNPLHKNKIRLFFISVKFGVWFLYKTMTKQTVHLNNFARKSGFRLQFLRQSAFQTHHCWRGRMTSPITQSFLKSVFKECLIHKINSLQMISSCKHDQCTFLDRGAAPKADRLIKGFEFACSSPAPFICHCKACK